MHVTYLPWLSTLAEGIVAAYAAALFLSLIHRRVAEVVTPIGCTAALVMAVIAAYGVLYLHGFATALDNLVALDPIGVWGLLVVGLLGFFESIYSIGYVRWDRMISEKFARVYYLLFNATMLAMAMAVLSNNIVFMWVAIEATTLATAFLVGLHRTSTAVEAAWKYIIICGVGVGFALFGTALVYNAALMSGIPAGSAITWLGLIYYGKLLAHTKAMALLKLGLLLITLGYATKAGLFPLHVWLPDAHSEAPTPISAILSGVIVKCALIVILRWYALASAIGLTSYVGLVLLIMGLASIIIGSLAILVQRDIKRLFAYSTVDQVGMISTAMGVGGVLGILAAVLHILYHALAKALAFMGSGLVMIFTGGERDMERLRGLIDRGLKISAGILTLAVLGVVAVPPGPSFYSKVLLFFASIHCNPVVPAIVLLGILLGEGTLMYRIVTLVFSTVREHGHEAARSEGVSLAMARDGGEVIEYSEKGAWSCKIACFLLAALVLGLFAGVTQYVAIAHQPMHEVVYASKYVAQVMGLHG